MADDTTSSPAAWPILNLVQRRLLGVLVEKAKTTPDAYPLSVNALTTGSNQKSNRDPLLDLSDDEVEEGLVQLQHLGLATRITGGRVERWRHNLYDLWRVDKVELAILAELLLRGPQTEGELRSRASRMEPIADLDALRRTCKPLQERGLIHRLGEEGRRGAQITHGFHDPAELAALHQRVVSGESVVHEPAPSRATPPSGFDQTLETLRGEVAELRARLSSTEDTVRSLAQELQELKRSLGA